jgi:rod shape determining protein RodA
MAMIEPSERGDTWRNADPAMLIITLLLLGFGLVTIFSADGRDLSLGSAAFKQGLFAVIGFGVMAVMAALDYRALRFLAIPMYLGGLALLVLVLQFGAIYHGAQRWFDLGFTSFQPSEPAKLAAIVAVAAFAALRGAHMRGPVSFGLSGLIAATPAVLVFIQPDLGTALIFVAIWLGIVVVARTRGIYLLGCAVAAVPLVWFFWHNVFHDYQKERLLTFREPERHLEYGGGNIIQAKIAIGQAGLIGHRFADAPQMNDAERLFASTSDFAFAHGIGNFGFIGALAVFALYLLLIWRYLRVAHLARDEFGRLIAMGATAMLFFQCFINIGMNVNILPVVGIPLPFISAGGTPLVTMLATQGILQSILMHRQKLAFGSG